MSKPVGNYVTNVAAAIAGHEGFSANHPDAPALYRSSMTFIVVYLVFLILFGAGAASLSYRYNVAAGTSAVMTGVYTTLAFLFSSLYYPYYALVLQRRKRNV
jgi:hypothetical protein